MTAWCNGCPADEINDNWTYMDLTRLSTSPHEAVMELSIAQAILDARGFFLETKKDLFFKYFRPVIDGVDGVRRDRDEGDKTLLPLVHSRHVKVSWRRGTRCSNNIDATTLESFQMPTHTLNWALPRRMQKRWDLTLSKAPLRTWRHWTCQASTARRVNPPRWPLPFAPACRSNPVTPPAFSGEDSHGNPPARDELGPLHVVLLVDKEELLVWSVAATKDQVWWHMETRRPDREQTSWSRTRCSLNIASDPPRSNWRASTSPQPLRWRKPTFWSHFVVHDGARRAKLPHVVEETELLLRSAVVDHLLSLRVDLSNRTKFSMDRHVRHRTTISEWHRNETKWVRHTFHEWMQRRASRYWQTLQFLSRIAPHALSDHHTRGERAYWCKLRLSALQCAKAPVSFIIFFQTLFFFWNTPCERIWIFYTSKKNLFKFCSGVLLWWSLLVLEKLSFSPAHRKVVLSSPSCYFSLFTFVRMASQKIVHREKNKLLLISFWFSLFLWKKHSLPFFQLSF